MVNTKNLLECLNVRKERVLGIALEPVTLDADEGVLGLVRNVLLELCKILRRSIRAELQATNTKAEGIVKHSVCGTRQRLGVDADTTTGRKLLDAHSNNFADGVENHVVKVRGAPRTTSGT